VNSLKKVDMERIWKAEIATLSISREARKIKGRKKEEKKIRTVQMILNMVVGSIKYESVSLFTTILSDVKL
jgi:hypothetical protein